MADSLAESQDRAERQHLRKRCQELLEWQNQANFVLGKWNKVFEAIPGAESAPWGASRAEWALKRVQEMSAEIEELKRRLGDG